jgi:branched-chain amino acid transport system ATP-binding protein
MGRPKLLLIDEASLGLSPVLTQTVFEVVKRINEDGTTVLMVEQNAGVLEIADRAFVMEKGALVYEGSGDDIIDHGEIRAAYLGAPA